MSVADKVRDAIKPNKTPAEQAAAEATELERHIERTKTERARRAATATDLQRQLGEATERQKLLKARRDPGLFNQFADLDQINRDLADVEGRVSELTTELAEAQEAIQRADLVLPEYEQQRKAAAAVVVNEKRRVNLAALAASCAEFEEWAKGGTAIWRRIHIQANREETLAAEVAVPRTDYVQTPSRIPMMSYLGDDPDRLVEQVRQFRKQLGQA